MKIHSNKFLKFIKLLCLVFTIMIITSCGPIIYNTKYIVKDSKENNWIQYPNGVYYNCDYCRLKISLPEIPRGGLWLALFVLPIPQLTEDKFNIYVEFINKSDNRTFAGTPTYSAESVKILIDGKLQLSEKFRIWKSGKKYSSGVYTFDIGIFDNNNDAALLFPDYIKVFDVNNNLQCTCSVPKLNIKCEEKMSFSFAVPGHIF